MPISEKTINDVKTQLRIEEVIGDFVALRKKRAGQNLWACCPFPGHNEKTPSFSIHPERGFYKCFGCGEAGDTLDFLMKVRGMSYIEAIEHVAHKYHIPIVLAKSNRKEDAKQRYKEGLYLLMEVACAYYQHTFTKSKEAQAYLTNRGINNELIAQFRIGYSPKAWRSFSDHAIQKGYDLQKLTDTGLITESNQQSYDRFRNRIMFPILNTVGQVVGFGGRTLDAKEQAKYINSPETMLYQKSLELYGIYQGKEAIRKRDSCYIVEGYTDVIAMHEVGLPHVVASSGTAMTAEQIAKLKRFTSNVTLLFDGDQAGLKAIFRGIDLLLAQDMNVKVVALPSGEDPASYIHKESKQAFIDYLIAHEKDFVTFKVQHLLGDNHEPEHRIAVVKDIVQSIGLMPDSIKQAVYIDLCSQLMAIKKDIIEQALGKLHYPEVGRAKTSGNQRESDPQEAVILKQLLQYGNDTIENEQVLAGIIFSELEDITFTSAHYKDVYEALLKQFQTLGRIDTTILLQEQPENVKKTMIDLMAKRYAMSPRWIDKHVVPQVGHKIEKLIYKNIHHLKRSFTQRRIDEETQRLNTLSKEENTVDQLHYFHALRQVQIDIERALGIAVSKL